MLLAEITVQSTKFDFYYFPELRMLCVESQGLGTIEAPVLNVASYPIALTSSSFNFNGVDITFNSNQEACERATNLKNTSFDYSVAELILSDSLASSQSD